MRENGEMVAIGGAEDSWTVCVAEPDARDMVLEGGQPRSTRRAGSLRGKKELSTREWVGAGGGVLRVASAHFSKRKPSHSGWGTC